MVAVNFKVGDRVRRIAGTDKKGMVLGQVYTVRQVMGSTGTYILVEEIPDNLPYWVAQWFELADESPPEEDTPWWR